MTRSLRRSALGLAMAGLLVACGGGGDDDDAPTSTGAVGSTWSTGATSSTAGGQSSATTAGGSDESTTSTTADTGSPGGTTTRYPQEGRYTYDVDGSTTIGATQQPMPDTSSLVVENLSATDQRHTQSTGDGSGESIFRSRDGAVLLVRLETSQAGITKEFRPDPPVVFAPKGLSPGDRWSWTMTSTDGKTTVRQSSRVLRQEQLRVGGQAVDTLVVQTTITITGDFKATTEQTSWASIKHRLVAKVTQTTRGTFGAIAFRSQSTSVLRSLNPS